MKLSTLTTNGKSIVLNFEGERMLDYKSIALTDSFSGDKIANEIKELRKVLQDILDLLRADVCTEQNVSSDPIKISINESVFDCEHLLRSQKPE